MPTYNYEQDYNKWLEQTVSLLKNKQFEQIDWDNLIEEIEGLNKRDRRQLYSCLVKLYEHKLKLDYWYEERERNQRGWRLTIKEQTRKLNQILADSPSLTNYLEEIKDSAYQDALEDVLITTEISDRFPQQNPY